MKIGIVATTVEFELGGIARSVPMLAAALARVGKENKDLDVDLFAVTTERMTIGSESGQVDLVEAGVNLRLFENRAKLKEALKAYAQSSGKPDFFYHVGVWDELNHFVSRLGKQSSIPVIASPRSMLDPWALNFRKWKKRLAWLGYAKRDFYDASAVHVTAEMEEKFVRDAGYKGNVFIVPNGVELPDRNAETGESPFDPFITKGDRVLLFLSRIHQKKGVKDLITAFGAINRSGWHLVIAGNDDGGYQRECEILANEQSNEKQIHFIGAVHDNAKWACYQSADVFILPSYSENFGIVIGEALGVGLPVITTTATPWKEVTHHQCGWWVEPGVHSIKKTLEEAMSVPATELEQMGLRGANWIREAFLWSEIGKRFYHALKELS